MATQLKREIKCSEAEWAARQDLAACYRIFDLNGWSESIYNHITLRVPGEEAFLINPFGLLWSEVTASNLVKIDCDGNKLCGSPHPVNLAGFTQHAVFHKRLPWAHAIVHTHTPDTMAVCASEDYQRRGYVEAFRAAVPTGGEVIYLDDGNGPQWGFLELLPVTPGMDETFTRFWRASRDWDGSDPVRSFL